MNLYALLIAFDFEPGELFGLACLLVAMLAIVLAILVNQKRKSLEKRGGE